jgi:hypothetical protein
MSYLGMLKFYFIHSNYALHGFWRLAVILKKSKCKANRQMALWRAEHYVNTKSEHRNNMEASHRNFA